MRSLFQVWSAVMIFLCTLSALSVNEAYSSSIKGNQALHVSIQETSVSADSQEVSSSYIVSVADSSGQDHRGDCGDRHPSHHQCHVGHCAFTIFSELKFSPKGSSALLDLSTSPLVGIELSGPRKPPRA